MHGVLSLQLDRSQPETREEPMADSHTKASGLSYDLYRILDTVCGHDQSHRGV